MLPPVNACRRNVPGVQDKAVQKALAQLKLAFDNLERLRPSISRDVLTQMFDLIAASKNPNVASLMPPSVVALSALSVTHNGGASSSGGGSTHAGHEVAPIN